MTDITGLNKVLVLAPHTDDAELGCGGTLVRMLENGVEVHVAAFSTARASLPPGSVPTCCGKSLMPRWTSLACRRSIATSTTTKCVN